MPRELNSDSPETTRLQRAAPGRMHPWPRAGESNPVAPYLTLAALAARWLTVRLALDEVWRKMKESNPAGSAPAHGFQDRLATIHRHLPNVKERCGGQGEGRTLVREGVSF